MTIRDRIIGSPELQDARAARDLDALAAGLNAQGLMQTVSHVVDMRTLANSFPDDSDQMIAGIQKAAQVSPTINEMLLLMRSGTGMDVGSPGMQLNVAKLVTNSLWTQDQADRFFALAQRPVVVTRFDVEDAMYNPDGSEKAE